jgi:hypothetical protein
METPRGQLLQECRLGPVIARVFKQSDSSWSCFFEFIKSGTVFASNVLWALDQARDYIPVISGKIPATQIPGYLRNSTHTSIDVK